MKKRIIYIVPHRLNRSPGQRFRCEHFLNHLSNDGYSITYANLLSSWDDEYFYKKGALFFKLIILIKSFFKRLYHVIIANKHDVVFIYREAFMIGTTWFERLLKLTGKPLIYDFDDAIWLNDTSEGNKQLAWLKNTKKTNTIIKLADCVIVGNSYLATHAKKFNKTVYIIPTTIDLSYHKSNKDKQTKNSICIGWTGTETTLKHFTTLESVLQKIQIKYANQVSFKIINNIPYSNHNLNITSVIWSAKDEIAELETIDIGIMPLPNNEWTQGKCGFKGLQYMALGIPTIMSPVGVNNDIIQHKTNGFLADNEKEWISYISELIENEKLRVSIGKEGQKTVEKYYSVESQKNNYIRIFNEMLKK